MKDCMHETMRKLLLILSGLVPNECRLFTSATLENPKHKEYAIIGASRHNSTK
jgi:hypothetical protein